MQHGMGGSKKVWNVLLDYSLLPVVKIENVVLTLLT